MKPTWILSIVPALWAALAPLQANPRIELDSREVPELRPWGEEAAARAGEWWPRLRNLLDSPEPAPETIQLVLKQSDQGVAHRSGDRIEVMSGWVRAHPEDLGLVIHELVHVIQNYPTGEPRWLIEGIADYLRWAIYEGWPLQRFPRPEEPAGYAQGYQATAGFLLWLEQGPAPGIVRRLDRALRANAYRDSLFEDWAAAPLDQLWRAYLDEQAAGNAGESPPR